MHDVEVTVVSDGFRLSASLTLPDRPGRAPVVVQAPGWLSLRSAAHYTRYRRALVTGGFAVLAIDYRGMGDSEGPREAVQPSWYIRDLRNAVSWAAGDERLDPERIALFGTGGVGAGAAIAAAAQDERVKAVAALSAVGDGPTWLRGMRSAEQWRSMLTQVEQNRRRMARGVPDEQVDPFAAIVLPTPERAAVGFKSDLQGRLPTTLGVSTIDGLLDFTPMAHVAVRAPTAPLLISCASDPVVPPVHATTLYELCREPKRRLVLDGATSYTVHGVHGDRVCAALVGWFSTFLMPADRGGQEAGGCG